MSMVIGGASIVVVEHKHSAMHCDAYKGKLEAVLQMIDRGDIGGGAWYGCDLHKEALAKVEQQIAETRARIAEMEAEEAGTDGVPASDGKGFGAKTPIPSPMDYEGEG